MDIIMPERTIHAVFGAMILLASPAAGQTTEQADAPKSSSSAAAALPPGWTARPDAGGDASKIRFVTMEPGFHVTLGPAAIFYRREDRAGGPFHTLARFHQMKETRHPEGYGLFVGGRDLAGKNQAYTYFLIRGDGSYLIKQRKGDTTSDISQGWTPHASVKKVDAQGKATNLLEIDAKRDSTKVDFKVNGQTVYSTDPKRLDLKGIVGLRVNHNLDVHIEDFAVHH
jgi:hypothetical protein